MTDTEGARQKARDDHRVSPHTEKATEQSIPDSTLREAYNRELDRQRGE